MAVRFYVSGYRNLEAEMDGERETMISPRFMQNENKDKAADYLREVAAELTNLYNAGEVDAAYAVLAEAENKISQAQTAEKFMKQVTF